MAESPKPGADKHLESPILTEREKPALDESTFQQLLEAAHVLQEQKTFEVVSRPGPDPTEALAQIVETQEFLRTQPDDLRAAATVVVERLQKITHATGVAVAVVRENQLEYCAATGDASSLAGTSLPTGCEPVCGRSTVYSVQPGASGQKVDCFAAASRGQSVRPARSALCGN